VILAQLLVAISVASTLVWPLSVPTSLPLVLLDVPPQVEILAIISTPPLNLASEDVLNMSHAVNVCKPATDVDGATVDQRCPLAYQTTPPTQTTNLQDVPCFWPELALFLALPDLMTAATVCLLPLNANGALMERELVLTPELP